MAFVTFDYKLQALIQPILTRYFNYQIWANCTIDNNGSTQTVTELVYTGRGCVTSLNDSLNSANTLDEHTVEYLATTGVNQLRDQYAGMTVTVDSYTIVSTDPRVSVICPPDGSAQPLAWCSDLVQDEVEVETTWIQGPTIDTSLYNSPDQMMPLLETNIKVHLARFATAPLPDNYNIISLLATSDNEAVVMELQDDNLFVFAQDAGDFPPELVVDEDTVTLVQGMTGTLNIQMLVGGESVDRMDELQVYINDPSIVSLVSVDDNGVVLQGTNVGTTTVSLSFLTSNVIVTVQVVAPQGQLDFSKSVQTSYVGDPTEIHFHATYENGSRFDIASSILALVDGDAEIQKIDESTYAVTPHASGILTMSISVTGATGDPINATIKMPVKDKQLNRFFITPRELQVVKGQPFTVTANYDVPDPEMTVDESLITWTASDESGPIGLEVQSGRSITLTPQNTGELTIQARLYNGADSVVATVYGETEPFITVSAESVLLKPNDTVTLFAQVVNGQNQPIDWSVEDNGLIKVLNQSDNSIEIQGLIDGTAVIHARALGMQKDITISVSSVEFQASDDPDPIQMDPGDQNTYYFPTEDAPEQWGDPGTPSSYVDGGGILTEIYGNGSGTEDPTYAFYSGIGDNDDLFVKKPQFENTVQKFNYAARMRGKKKHSVMIYPEIDFQYSIQYKGDFFTDYNESPFKFEVDAYPQRDFHFTINETRKLQSLRDYSVKMTIGGTVPKKTLQYAVEWTGAYEISNTIDIRALFDKNSGEGHFVGAGKDTWELLSNGHVVDHSNQSRFSGSIARNTQYFNPTWAYNDFEVHFTPVIDLVTDYHAPLWGNDDDIIGVIFKAQNDWKNFYCFMWERDERVQYSWRAGNNLDGLPLGFTDSEWEAHCVTEKYQDPWSNYVHNLGWGDRHYRVYRCKNGKFYRVNTPDLSNGDGWVYEKSNGIRIHADGNHIQIYILPSGASNWRKVFEFDTEYETGSFGLFNISQAVEFTSCTITRWQPISGRVPDSPNWDSWDGIGTKTLASSGSDYVDADVKKAAGGKPYEILSVKGVVKDSSAGKIDASLNGAVTITTTNPPDAGKSVDTEFIKQGTVTITPDNTSESTAVVVFSDPSTLFTDEIKQFKENNPTLVNVTPTYTLEEPTSSDEEFSFDGKTLKMWKSDPPTETSSKDFTCSVYAYEGWKTAATLTSFEGGPWATYTVTMNEADFNPDYDQVRWHIAGDIKNPAKDNDYLEIKTTEWYHGIWPADVKNEGTVNSEQRLYIDIPPMPEHYVEPHTGEVMYHGYDKVDFLLTKDPVGKDAVWMYFKSNPNITTRNAASLCPINPINGYPVIKTNLINDQVVVVCDPDPRYIPWISGKYIGYGKVNGKRPFFSDNTGKADMINVPTDVVYLPPNLVNIQGPFVEVDDPRVQVSVNPDKTVNFSSDYMDAYVWYTDWYTDWVNDPNNYFATLDQPTEITDPVYIDPTLAPDYDENVIIDHVEVTSNNPFVATWVNPAPTDTHGLLGTYYKMPNRIDPTREKFQVTGDYRLRQQVFTVNEPVDEYREPGTPVSEAFLPGIAPIVGTVPDRQVVDVTTIFVPAGQPVLKILGAFFGPSGDHYPDLQVTAPNGEQFGIAANNGTWSQTAISITQFANGTSIKSCSQYSFAGENDLYDLMTFTNPMTGVWKIQVYNGGIESSEYTVTTNIGTLLQNAFTLQHVPDAWNVKVKVNGTPIPGFTVDGSTVTITDPLNKDDVVEIDYTTGGLQVDALPMQSEFEFQDSPPFTIVSVQRNGVDIPEDPTNGYTVQDDKFYLHGSALTPGDVVVQYAMGSVNNVFTLANPVGEGVEVYLNGVKLDPSQYTVSGTTLVIQKSLLHLNDWVHIQSYQLLPGFDTSKNNYLGEFQFSRIDPAINFDWGYSSPFAEETSPVQASEFTIEEVIPDTADFDFILDATVVYPTNSPISIDNFTGTWVEFDTDPTSKGNWHGPPEDGYTDVTNLENQNGQSGWYNPDHVNLTDYAFSFKVQTRAGDDDVIGALFRFDPDTLNFYSFEWDAEAPETHWILPTKGMYVFRNICLNPQDYGKDKLVYEREQLGYFNQAWEPGQHIVHEVLIQVFGSTIIVTVDGEEKIHVTDPDSTKVLTKGAWGPLTQSQPESHFWDFLFTTYQQVVFSHHIQNSVPVPVSDTNRTATLQVIDHTVREEFQEDINELLDNNVGVDEADLIVSYQIVDDHSDVASVYFDDPAQPTTNMPTSTSDQNASVYAKILTKPQTAPEVPDYGETRHTTLDYPPPDVPSDVYVPNQPEPYIPDMVPPPTTDMSDGFAVSWRGRIYAPVSGVYTFYATVDDGFRLWIDNRLIIDAWKDNPGGVTYTGSIELEGGKWYTFSANYFEDTDRAMVRLEWEYPGSPRQVIGPDYFVPYLGYTVMAQVREATPLPWSPMIHNGYYYFQDKEFYLYANKVHIVTTPVDNTVLLQPRPQQGSPLIVRDNEGNILRKVTFFDDDWNLTLEYTDEMTGNGGARYFLAYRDIDPNTLKVYVNGELLGPSQYVFDPKKSVVEFMKNLGFSDIIVLKYKLLYSYMVDYNYDVENDVAKLTLHDAYDPALMRDMEIIYEGATDTPFYRASDEVSFNPILNHNHRGFLYITNKLDETAKSIELTVSPDKLPASGTGKCLVTVKVLDKYNNPIQRKDVQIFRDGELVFSGKTNRAGEVYLYEQPAPTPIGVSQYQAVCDGLYNVALLNFYQPNVAKRYFVELKASKAAIQAGVDDTVTITATVRDENWMSVPGVKLTVTYKDTLGRTRTVMPITDAFGQTTITISGEDLAPGAFPVYAIYDMGVEEASNFIFIKVIGG